MLDSQNPSDVLTTMSGSNNLPRSVFIDIFGKFKLFTTQLISRHDFYQTDAHVIISLYIKGYGAPAVKDQVKVAYEAGKVCLVVSNS